MKKCIFPPPGVALEAKFDQDRHQRTSLNVKNVVFSSIKVKSISLNELLQNEKKVSLIDMDIQGEEINLIKSEIETLNRKVEKMYVATHSKKIEEEIILFLGKKNWQLTTYLKGGTLNKTKFGPIKCQDGVQIWENKNFFK